MHNNKMNKFSVYFLMNIDKINRQDFNQFTTL